MPVKTKLKGLLFFWTKKKERPMNEKAEEMIQLYIKYIPQIRAMMRQAHDEDMTSGSIGHAVGQMYDFFKDLEPSLQNAMEPWTPVSSMQDRLAAPKDERKEAKPLAVRDELEEVPAPWSVENDHLQEKIDLLKDKTLLVNQRHSKEQIEGLIKRLENRKVFIQEAAFYVSFPNTTDEKIDALLKKYKLECRPSDLFVPTFPKEAVDVMKKYSEVTKRLTGEDPVYYVIAESADFIEKRKKLDPILLVQSPFGFYWQILGAWDKEMLLLSEL